MNKKVNTALFILGATLINMVLIFLFILLFVIIVGMLFPEPSPGAAQLMFLLIFVLSLASSFLIYHKSMKWIARKVDMDKYFHPIFRSRRK